MRRDAITVEILRNYLQGAVEEMAYVVERTAYTTFVKETADFTCGLLNPSGEFFAYPVELGVASFGGINYAHTLEAVGPLDPGDVVITNDPYGSAAADQPSLSGWFRSRSNRAATLNCVNGLKSTSLSPLNSDASSILRPVFDVMI